MDDMNKTNFPIEFEVATGGCFGPSFTVRFVDGKLMYEKSGGLYSLAPATEINPTQEQWTRFWERMNELGIWNWSPHYEQCSIGHEDGNHWFVNIAIDNRSVRSEGEDVFPGSSGTTPSKEFEQFLEALRELLGGVEFW